MPKAGSGVKLDGQGQPLWLCLELTYRCPLQCPWCSNPVDFADYSDELTTEEWKRVLREGRELGALQLGFTGGEPLIRKDLEELVDYANGLGYYTNLITSGMGLTEERLLDLKKAGLKQIQLSIQSCDSNVTNELVGTDAHDKKLAVAKLIKKHDFPMVLNVPVVRQNVDLVPGILKMAEELKVEFLEFANVQYYNWALLNRKELIPTKEQLDRAEAAVNETRARVGDDMTIYFVIPDYYDGKPKACMNGWGNIHLTVAPDGAGLPCQECRVLKDVEYNSVRDHSLGWIWHESPAFNLYRGQDWMKEPCKTCDEKEQDFGGCRCQSYLLTGDATNTDPACSRSPFHNLVEETVKEANAPNRIYQPLVMRRANRNESAAVGG